MKIKDYFKENSSAKILAIVIAASILILSYGIWSESRSGRIEIYVPKSGASVFLDEKRAGIANTDGQIITLKRVRPGEHSVLVYLEGYYPWEKIVNISTGKKIQKRAFFVRKKYSSSYKKTDFTKEENKNISKLFKKNSSKKISFAGDGNVEIKKEGRKIFASWVGGDNTPQLSYFCDKEKCNKSIIVFESANENIDTIDFYPNREDVILFSIKDGIYAIEIDKRGIQNFQPLYLSNNASFRVNKEGSLFVKEGKDFFEIIL